MVGAVLEVFKYAVKLGDLAAVDAVEVFSKTRGMRMVQAFGCLFGVPEPELEDEPLTDSELEFIEHLYVWCRREYVRRKSF
jgi:hypothetical protein